MHATARAQHVRCARVDPGSDAPARRDRGPSAYSARSETDSLLRCYPRSYYGVLMHELVHWTGAKGRCDRDLSGRFGDAAYAFEELVAEIGSAFLCGDLGISPQPRADNVEYVRHWLKVLRDDKKAIFTAASLSRKAAEALHAMQPALMAEAA